MGINLTNNLLIFSIFYTFRLIFAKILRNHLLFHKKMHNGAAESHKNINQSHTDEIPNKYDTKELYFSSYSL